MVIYCVVGRRRDDKSSVLKYGLQPETVLDGGFEALEGVRVDRLEHCAL